MAFEIKNFSPIGGQARLGNSPAQWSYESSTDDLAAVQGANYFDELGTQVSPGDFINVVLTDGKVILTVDSIVLSPPGVVIDAAAIGGGNGSGQALYTFRDRAIFTNNPERVVPDLTRSDYLIRFMNFLPSSGVNEAVLRMECSNDNGVSFITSNYQYVAIGLGMDGGSANTNNSTAAFIGITPEAKKIGGDGPVAFEYGVSGEIRLSNVSNATQPMYVFSEGQYQDKDRKGFRFESGGMTTDKNATAASFNINTVKLFFDNSVSNMSGRIEVWEGIDF